MVKKVTEAEIGTAEQTCVQIRRLVNQRSRDTRTRVEDMDMERTLYYVGKRIKDRRYMWTESRGIIDMKHAFVCAGLTIHRRRRHRTPMRARDSVLGSGEAVEGGLQAARGLDSTWRFEDLPSNKAGVDFVLNIERKRRRIVTYVPKSAATLPEAWKFFTDEELGGSYIPPSAKDFADLAQIRNFGYTPVLSPDDENILTSDDGIRYVSSGHPSADKRRLDQIRRVQRMIREGRHGHGSLAKSD